MAPRRSRRVLAAATFFFFCTPNRSDQHLTRASVCVARRGRDPHSLMESHEYGQGESGNRRCICRCSPRWKTHRQGYGEGGMRWRMRWSTPRWKTLRRDAATHACEFRVLGEAFRDKKSWKGECEFRCVGRGRRGDAHSFRTPRSAEEHANFFVPSEWKSASCSA